MNYNKFFPYVHGYYAAVYPNIRSNSISMSSKTFNYGPIISPFSDQYNDVHLSHLFHAKTGASCPLILEKKFIHNYVTQQDLVDITGLGSV